MIETVIYNRLVIAQGSNSWTVAPCQAPDDSPLPVVLFFVKSSIEDSLIEAGNVRIDVYAMSGAEALAIVAAIIGQGDPESNAGISGVREDDAYQLLYQSREAQADDVAAVYSIDFIFRIK